jgi:hypothetical protein
MGAVSSRLCVSLLDFCIQIQDPEYTGRNNHLHHYIALTTPQTLKLLVVLWNLYLRLVLNLR